MLRGEPCAEVLDLAEPAGLREVACVHEHVAARQLAEATVLAVRVRDAHEAHGRLVSLRWEPPKLFDVERLATAAATLDQRRPCLLPREAVELARERRRRTLAVAAAVCAAAALLAAARVAAVAVVAVAVIVAVAAVAVSVGPRIARDGDGRLLLRFLVLLLLVVAARDQRRHQARAVHLPQAREAAAAALQAEAARARAVRSEEALDEGVALVLAQQLPDGQRLWNHRLKRPAWWPHPCLRKQTSRPGGF